MSNPFVEMQWTKTLTEITRVFSQIAMFTGETRRTDTSVSCGWIRFLARPAIITWRKVAVVATAQLVAVKNFFFQIKTSGVDDQFIDTSCEKKNVVMITSAEVSRNMTFFFISFIKRIIEDLPLKRSQSSLINLITYHLMQSISWKNRNQITGNLDYFRFSFPDGFSYIFEIKTFLMAVFNWQ